MPVRGHYVKHKSGTISFMLYNADEKCPVCGLRRLEEKKGHQERNHHGNLHQPS